MNEQRQASTSSEDQIRAERAGIQPSSPPQSLPESGDLHATLPLSQQQARDGTSRAIRLPGGRQTNVVVPAGAHEGQVISLEGLGEPAFPGGPGGRLILTLMITPAEEPPAEAVPTKEKRTARYSPRLTQSRALLLIGLMLLLALTVIGSTSRLALTQHALPSLLFAPQRRL